MLPILLFKATLAFMLECFDLPFSEGFSALAQVFKDFLFAGHITKSYLDRPFRLSFNYLLNLYNFIFSFLVVYILKMCVSICRLILL